MAEIRMKGHAKLMPGILDCNYNLIETEVKTNKISWFKRIWNFIIVGLLAKK